ncbi:ribonuclease III [Dendrothele bispora CBS 962.96]|uniref:Ribonuclease III n=1 Tax=Dendrothele bispora (strain CBS 962.96) TaxID=1314807 RepID=A0A4S8MW12_DENBC|nr:ribonuclease III [Dendrothele bispora CBS 962.96]
MILRLSLRKPRSFYFPSQKFASNRILTTFSTSFWYCGDSNLSPQPNGRSMADNHPLPPLPRIEGDLDLALAVFTHSSLAFASANNNYDNSERLAFLGERVLELAVTDHFFKCRPMLTVDEIDMRRKIILSEENYKRWIDGYELRSRLRVNPNIPNPLDIPQEMEKFFQSYVGAVFLRHGMGTITNWISPLIDPNNTSAPLPEYSTSTPYYNDLPPPPKGAPPHLPGSPSTSGLLVTLASFHEQAAKNGFHVTYQAQSEGQSHLPTWTVRCFVNNEERGRGVGKNQKIAKEEAARKAWASMGW